MFCGCAVRYGSLLTSWAGTHIGVSNYQGVALAKVPGQLLAKAIGSSLGAQAVPHDDKGMSNQHNDGPDHLNHNEFHVEKSLNL